MAAAAAFKVALLDVEGTVTPVSFVHDVLFPYARERIAGWMRVYADDPEIQAAVVALRREHAAESGPERPPAWSDVDPGIYACWLIDHDRKSTPLKALQGRIWEEGYRAGLLTSPVFGDVPEAFRRWSKGGREISIFSSGSVLAQRQLFAHTTAGDLTKLISRYFDTTTGPKRERRSYERIASDLGRPPADVLFVSDVREELDAAREAGMTTALCVRPGAPPPAPAAAHPVVRTFDELP
jgi:enolase-phosphatase E1